MRSLFVSIAVIAMASGLAQAQPGQEQPDRNGEVAGEGADASVSVDHVPPGTPAAAPPSTDRARPATERSPIVLPSPLQQTADPREIAPPSPDSRPDATAAGREGEAPGPVATTPAQEVHRPTPKPVPKVARARIAPKPSLREVQRFRTERRAPLRGCPPGLQGEPGGCDDTERLYRQSRSYRPGYFALRGVSPGEYRYKEGYLLRFAPDERSGGYIPLLGGGLSLGSVWPRAYAPVTVPDYFRNFYDLGPDSGYRYADDVLYRVDPTSRVITAVAAILTGDQIDVGDPLPAGYSIYNVPLGYRDRYRDDADAIYRYADGYIYRADPETHVVGAIIELLT